MSRARLHPFTLRFSSNYLEAAFRVDYVRRSLLLVRWALVLGLVQYAGFGLLDRWLVPSSLMEVRLVRAGACAVLALGIAYTFAPSFRRSMQVALAAVPLLGGLGVVAMVAFAQTADGYYQYYVGLTLILVYVHVLLRLRFIVASAVGGVLIAAYIAVAAMQETPPYLLANNVFFLLSANLSGMVASYALERYARLAFVQARQQTQNNAILADAFDRLRATQSQLIQQEKLASLGRLTAGVAHEIRNPLNFVSNFAELSDDLFRELEVVVIQSCQSVPPATCAELTNLTADLRHNLAKIQEHSRRADGIVQGMLEHARPGPGVREVVELNRLVADHTTLAHESFRVRYPDTECRLSLDLDAAVGEVVVAPQEIGRVVRNLVGNALLALCERAGDDGYAPTLVVRTRRGFSTVTVEVADNGPGIAATVRERIFEPFFTTRPAGQGTGLGLSLAADVAAAHGGMLTVESEEGQGATFTLTLPLAPSRAIEEKASEPARPEWPRPLAAA
ncbi:MAG: hypothetical protein HKN04_10200 [Rhodothermaceae bacterium]|nr:hypothetical protein [Rhodothermaceae bacterium]